MAVHPSEVKYVFLDTQVFDSNQYDLNSANFRTLIALAEVGTIKLFSTDIVQREVLSHLKERAKSAFDSIKKTQRFCALLSNVTSSEIKGLFLDITPERLFEEFKRAFTTFCERSQMEILSTNHIDIETVLEKYFQKCPPFGIDKKKSEFPDAINVLTLQSWCNCHFKNVMHVVSGDPDWPAACKSHEPLRHWPLMAELLAVFPKPKLSAAILKGFRKHEKYVREMVEVEFAYQNFSLQNLEGQVSNVKVISVEIEKLYVVEALNGTGRVDAECFVKYECDVHYDVPGSSQYDQQERCFNPPVRDWCHFTSGRYQMAEVTLTWDTKSPAQVSIENVKMSTSEFVIEGRDIVD